MLKTIEKLLVKLRGNTAGYDFNMFDWDILSLGEKCRLGRRLTKSEEHARNFLAQMNETFNIWHPPEKWRRPYGDVLNEKRKLH